MAQGSKRDLPQPARSDSPTLAAEEVARILALRGAERESRLLASDRLAAVVPRLPPEELFFTLSGMSGENLPTVLAHVRTEQLEFLLDLDLWKKDRIREERVAPWLQALDGCGARALGRWLKELDLADLTLLLGQLAEVRVADEQDEDPLQTAAGRAPFTLDGLYHVVTAEEREPLVRNLLLATRSVSEDRYTRLMEALVRDVNSELEEHCFELRQRRLALRGIPEWEEAMEVYARLEVDSVDDLPQRTEPRPSAEGAGPAPTYALALGNAADNPLRIVLAALPDDADRETLGADLVWLTHKVAVADGLDLSRVDSFVNAVDKVSMYVSIGLQSLCGADPGDAASVIRRCWVQHLFRVGWTRIRRLRTRARRFLDSGWPQGHKERLLFLDEPLPQILEGLLMKHPLRYDSAAEGIDHTLFRSLEQVEAAEWALGKSEFLGRFLLSLVDLRLGDLREALLRLDTENLKGSTVFLTSLVNAALDRGFRFAPLEKEAVGAGLDRIWEPDRFPRRVRAGLRDSAVQWAESVIPLSALQEQFLIEFVRDCFQLLEEEFGHLATDEIPDPRFTKGIWIE